MERNKYRSGTRMRLIDEKRLDDNGDDDEDDDDELMVMMVMTYIKDKFVICWLSCGLTLTFC